MLLLGSERLRRVEGFLDAGAADKDVQAEQDCLRVRGADYRRSRGQLRQERVVQPFPVQRLRDATHRQNRVG